jgi:23S rRNA (guanine745-N1)-methyltransferase
LRCPVRGCGAPLAREERGLRCPAGHAFDRARSGYFNLLQPQDRRSKRPGDPKAVVLARRRFLDAGHEAPFLDALLAAVAALGLSSGAAVLDVGCGEGHFLHHLARGFPIEAHGLDLSTPAIELAARRFPAATWVVANADRTLPYADGAFALVLSLTARRNFGELARVLAPEGRLLLALPAADDLLELRQVALGEGTLRDRTPATLAELAPCFAVAERRTVRWQAELDAAGLADVLLATYRAGRSGRQERLASLPGLRLTFARDLLLLAPHAALPRAAGGSLVP